MPPIYLTSDLLSYKRKPNFLNAYKKTVLPDPFYSSVILYIKGDLDIVDDSSQRSSITNTGGVVIDNVNYKYGTGSLYFPGSHYLSIDNAVFAGIKTGDYTVDFWMKVNTGTGQTLFQFGDNRNTGYEANTFNDNLRSFANNYGPLLNVTNTWAHVAVVKQGTSLIAYLNGNIVGTVATSVSITSSLFNVGGPLHINNGNMDSFRVTTAARYTANFDPETDTYLAY